MKKLTFEDARRLCFEYFNKLEDREQADFLILHSKNASETAVMIAQNRPDMNLNIETLRIAGFVHDIGYFIEEENHAEHSIELLEKEYELDEKLRDCILNHGTGSVTKIEEGKII